MRLRTGAGGVAELGRIILTRAQDAADVVDGVRLLREKLVECDEHPGQLLVADHVDQSATAHQTLRRIEGEGQVFHQRRLRPHETESSVYRANTSRRDTLLAHANEQVIANMSEAADTKARARTH
ncbi:MAG: hypothetical protein EOP24_40680 [Hyphomicrobiales bacterium]|nr:MAG: hypothetical protein EOP24_40680 [Hyphomicrobiales bacterium]